MLSACRHGTCDMASTGYLQLLVVLYLEREGELELHCSAGLVKSLTYQRSTYVMSISTLLVPTVTRYTALLVVYASSIHCRGVFQHQSTLRMTAVRSLLERSTQQSRQCVIRRT